MKFVKFSILALAMGIFVASCGNTESTEETVDSSAMMTTEPVAPVDTVTAAPATDTTVVVDTTVVAH
jgi:hypothetical protein